MKTLFIGKNCIEVEKTDSTNSYLASLTLSTEKEAFEGTIVVAKHQEQGRGQRGTTWSTEPGKNLTLSILLNPTFLKAEEQFQLNKALSLGVLEFIRLSVSPPLPFSPSGLESGNGRKGESGGALIKWPNDIYIGNKKVAGILIENSVSGSSLQQSIVGIGINVNQDKFPAEIPNPISLKIVSGQEFDLKECLAELCSCIEKRYLELRAGRLSEIDKSYLQNLYRLGELADYKYNGQIIKAKITGVNIIGKLLLQMENGEKQECDFKEVEFLY